jgi:thiopurine S-methyltransferase
LCHYVADVSSTDAAFWLSKWEANEIAFHEGRPNALLERHAAALALGDDARVFVPLCGKTRDIPWLLARGYRVAGAELSAIAVGQLFADLGVEPRVERAGPLMRYSAPGVDIFQGDLFDLSARALGAVDAIYDRAALVALPAPIRDRYTATLVDLTEAAPQLLICLEYDQAAMGGPPFSVTADEVRRLYGGTYDVNMLETGPLAGGLRGMPTTQTAWLLRPTRG